MLNISWASGHSVYCIVPNCKSNPSFKICKSALINLLVTNPHSWSLPEWRVQFAYLILHLLFSDGKPVIMVQACPAALLVNKRDLPVSAWATKEFKSPPDPGPRQNLLSPWGLKLRCLFNYVFQHGFVFQHLVMLFYFLLFLVAII